MTLHDMIQSDAETVFCNVNDFAEVVTYYSRNTQSYVVGGAVVGSAYVGLSAATTRAINAVVFRESIAVFSEDGDTVLPVFEVHVNNDSTLGIASDELNLGGDQIGFGVRVNQSAERRSITRLKDHDEGMLVLECR